MVDRRLCRLQLPDWERGPHKQPFISVWDAWIGEVAFGTFRDPRRFSVAEMEPVELS
jgi:hypothetical protein